MAKKFKNRYRGFIILIEQESEDKAEFKVTKSDGTVIEDSEGFCVTVDEAMDNCKEYIDDMLDI